MSQFVFLYRGGMPADTSAAEMQQQMQRWMTWLKDLGEKGFVKDPGQPLERGGKLVSGKQKMVTDGPYAEKDLVSGYTLVEAKDLAHAAELSLGCPIFTYGGAVEVRPVAKM
ncbi:MAG TPA: YciI family protein [Polyangia bacterium]|nr:YciI family protein [Polyangia bacterium]